MMCVREKTACCSSFWSAIGCEALRLRDGSALSSEVHVTVHMHFCTLAARDKETFQILLYICTFEGKFWKKGFLYFRGGDSD